MFTIMSEFTNYSEQDLLAMSFVKLDFIYKEALRSRASKFTLLAQLILRPNMEKEEQRKLNESVNEMLTPHKVVVDEKSKKSAIDSGWAFLRARQKI